MEGVLDLNWPSVQEAKEYVERHHLEQLFKNLTALLILKQPSWSNVFRLSIIFSIQTKIV